MRIAICVPTHTIVPSKFALFLSNFTMFSYAAAPEGTEIGIKFIEGTYVHSARQQLLENCLEEGWDYVLWLDSDMTFPPDTLAHLIGRDKAVVGANYSTRGLPADFVAIKKTDEKEGEVGQKCVTGPHSTGLEEVDAIGFGCVLLDLNKIRDALPEGEQWFWYEITEKGAHMGEDVYFCRLLRRAGIPIYVDHDLSRQVKHVGQLEYHVDHAYAQQVTNGDHE